MGYVPHIQVKTQKEHQSLKVGQNREESNSKTLKQLICASRSSCCLKAAGDIGEEPFGSEDSAVQSSTGNIVLPQDFSDPGKNSNLQILEILEICGEFQKKTRTAPPMYEKG